MSKSFGLFFVTFWDFEKYKKFDLFQVPNTSDFLYARYNAKTSGGSIQSDACNKEALSPGIIASIFRNKPFWDLEDQSPWNTDTDALVDATGGFR